MIIKPTKDIEEIKQILHHPDIYPEISDTTEKVDPPITDDYLYIAGYVDGEIIGVLIYHEYLDGNECHVQVLKSHRAEYAAEFGKKALKFRGIKPLYAEIPDYYQNVLEFAKSMGFQVIDYIIGDFEKDGTTYNTNILRFQDGIC